MPDAPRMDVVLGYLHPDTLTSNFSDSFLDLIGHDLSGPCRLRNWVRIKCGALGVPGGRNDLAAKFLETDAQWLFMVDADMGFAPDTLDNLLAVADPVERPIVGGLTFAQRELGPDGLNGFRCYPQPVIMDRVKQDDGVWRMVGRRHYPANALVRCDATGGAMLVIHRSVFERLHADAPDVGPFEQIREDNGALVGEDVSFFQRTYALGIPLHVHTAIRTNHYKHLWLGESDFWTSFHAPPATEPVDVIVPVLHRPHNVAPLMESLRASTGLATAYFVCEPDDGIQAAAVREAGGVVCQYPNAHTFAEKVNKAFHDTFSPWVLLVGDDVRFRPGWLDHALDVARRYGADVVGTNDLANPRVLRGEHATHPLIRRSYVVDRGASWDGPGVVCHDGYSHWFVDDEIVTVAKQRRTFQPALGSHVAHLHPLFGTAPDDDVYKAGAANADTDAKLYRKRFVRYARADVLA